MTQTEVTQSIQADQHDRADREYGSWSAFQDKLRLDHSDKPLRAEYEALSKAHDNEEDIIEHMTSGLPYPIDSITLTSLPLYLIGAPDGSEAHKRIFKDRSDIRIKRKPEVRGGKPPEPFWCDYTNFGWPKTQGDARRMVSPEEHREILRKLQTSTLTRPGSEVALKGQTLASLVEEDLPQPAWIIEGLLREGGAMMVYGPTGIGKTYFTHTLMLLAAHGRSVGIQEDGTDRWVLQAGPHQGYKVGLIDGEMRKEDIAERAVALCGALGLRPGCSDNAIPALDVNQLRIAMEAQGIQPEDIALWTAHYGHQADVARGTEAEGDVLDLGKIDLRLKTDQHPKVDFPDLVSTEWKQQIIEYCLSEGIKVLILDNLSTLSPTLEDENASAQIAPLNDLIVALKQAGVATILVHHSGKSKDGGYRGSSAIMTVLETALQLEAVDDEKSPEARFKVVYKKGRVFSGRNIEGRTLRLQRSDPQRWTVEADPLGMAERIARAYASLEYTTQAELGDALTLTQPEVSKALKAAYAAGTLKKDDIEDFKAKAKQMRKAMAEPYVEEPEPEELDI